MFPDDRFLPQGKQILQKNLPGATHALYKRWRVQKHSLSLLLSAYLILVIVDITAAPVLYIVGQ